MKEKKPFDLLEELKKPYVVGIKPEYMEVVLVISVDMSFQWIEQNVIVWVPGVYRFCNATRSQRVGTGCSL